MIKVIRAYISAKREHRSCSCKWEYSQRTRENFYHNGFKRG